LGAPPLFYRTAIEQSMSVRALANGETGRADRLTTRGRTPDSSLKLHRDCSASAPDLDRGGDQVIMVEVPRLVEPIGPPQRLPAPADQPRLAKMTDSGGRGSSELIQANSGHSQIRDQDPARRASRVCAI
jgi:hypothetical protein